MDTHTVANIAELQDREKQLHNDFSSLETQELKKESLEKMQQLTQTRIELFNALKSQYAKDVAESKDELKDQMETLSIVENELGEAKNRLARMQDEHTNKMRMAEFATYFSLKYKSYNELLMLTLKWMVPIGLLLYIANRNPIPENYLSQNNSNSLFLVLITVVTLYALYQILTAYYDISLRNNMNFNQYDFGSNIKTGVKKDSTFSHDTKEFGKMAESLHLGCVDSYCCADGTLYDSVKRQCIPAIKTHNENNKKASLAKGAMGTPSIMTDIEKNIHDVEGFSSINVPFSSV